METAFLFPGQGGYDAHALALARERYPRVTEVFAEIDGVARELFSQSLSEILFTSPVPDIAGLLTLDTWVSQLAIYGAGMAAHRLLTDRGVRPDVLVGHSLGEIAALAAAGVFSIADGARIVGYRVLAVEQLNPGAGRMVALSVGPARAEKLRDLLEDDLVALAAENHDKQTVLSGPQRSLGRVLGIARHLEIGAVELNSPYPFHSPMLAPAVPVLAERIASLESRRPEVPVYSPILEEYYTDTRPVADLLASHLVRPVRFSAAVRKLRAEGVHTFVEAGGLTALSRLVTKNLPDDPAVTTAASLTVDGTGLALDRLGTRDNQDPETVRLLAAAIAPGVDLEVFSAFWAAEGRQIAESVRGGLARFVPAEPAAPAAPAASRAVDRDALADELRAQYAAALEYPEEVFTEDVRLEAELGIDSVKQVELLTRVSEKYGLPERDGGIRLGNYDTMSKIIDYIHGSLQEKAA